MKSLPMAPPEPGRCSGQCCSALLLGGDPNYLRRRARRARFRVLEDGGTVDDPRLKEWAQIAGMMEYLGEVANPARPGAPVDHWYRCKNQDRETGDCTIYETRPNMCRAFPSAESGCKNTGCTFVHGAAA